MTIMKRVKKGMLFAAKASLITLGAMVVIGGACGLGKKDAAKDAAATVQQAAQDTASGKTSTLALALGGSKPKEEAPRRTTPLVRGGGVGDPIYLFSEDHAVAMENDRKGSLELMNGRVVARDGIVKKVVLDGSIANNSKAQIAAAKEFLPFDAHCYNTRHGSGVVQWYFQSHSYNKATGDDGNLEICAYYKRDDSPTFYQIEIRPVDFNED